MGQPDWVTDVTHNPPPQFGFGFHNFFTVVKVIDVKAVADFHVPPQLNRAQQLAAAGDLQELDKLLDEHPEIVNAVVPYDAARKPSQADTYTLLHFAANRGHRAVAEDLLSRGANVDAANHGGQTALSLAAEAGHAELVKSLLEKGAKIDKADWMHATPLMRAAQFGHLEAVKLLVTAGADIHAKSKPLPEGFFVPAGLPAGAPPPPKSPAVPGRTAAGWAESEGHAEVAQYLNSQGK
jgi:ankyrin repeat protein